MCNRVELRLQIPDALIEDHRYDEFDFDWWEYTVEDFFDNGDGGIEARTGIWTNPLDHTGKRYAVHFDIYRQEMYFEAGVYDWEKFLTVNNLVDKFPSVLRYHQYGQGDALTMKMELIHYGCSCYVNRLEYDDSGLSWEFNSDLDEATVELMDEWLCSEVNELKGIVEDKINELYGELLALLDQESKWLTSDENVTERIGDRYTDDELIQWCLDNDNPVVWSSSPC